MAREQSAWKGFAAGAIGGLAGTVVLNVFQKASLEGTRAVESKSATAKPTRISREIY